MYRTVQDTYGTHSDEITTKFCLSFILRFNLENMMLRDFIFVFSNGSCVENCELGVYVVYFAFHGRSRQLFSKATRCNNITKIADEDQTQCS